MNDQKARHVAIIMDGNARWARRRDLSPIEGHREGAKALRRTVRNAVKHGVEELTVYAFSTENWSRPEDEVSGLMEMFADLTLSETPELRDQGVRMRFIGRLDAIDEDLRKRIEWAHAETSDNKRMVLYLGFNYGGRAEVLDAAARYRGGGDEEFVKLLYAPEMSDPDLLIRTSGEHRLSNFLLWQTAYSELYFTEVLWPDFEESDLVAALDEYSRRRRTFGAR